MRKATCLTRWSWITLVSLVSALLFMGPSATAATCSVTNERIGVTYGQPQRAVDAADRHDTLLIEGTCIGRIVIRDTALRLEGSPTAEHPAPTLDGHGETRVLMIEHARVVLRGLTITNGRAPNGGGIRIFDGDIVLGNSRVVANTARGNGGGLWLGGYPKNDERDAARLTLKGSSSVWGNIAGADGGGLWINYRGLEGNDVLVKGSSSVSGNSAGGSGGGLWIADATIGGSVILTGTASVTGNTAADDGGGVSSSTMLDVEGSASVSGNEAGDQGGGIFAQRGLTVGGSASVFDNSAADGAGIYYTAAGPGSSFTMNDAFSVTGNAAAGVGGGIYAVGYVSMYDAVSVTGNTATGAGGGIFVAGSLSICSDLVAISPNDPDDPPAGLACS